MNKFEREMIGSHYFPDLVYTKKERKMAWLMFGFAFIGLLLIGIGYFNIGSVTPFDIDIYGLIMLIGVGVYFFSFNQWLKLIFGAISRQYKKKEM